MVIYWFGFVDELSRGPDDGVLIADGFPPRRDLITLRRLPLVPRQAYLNTGWRQPVIDGVA